MRRLLIAGNWKMNGSVASVDQLVSGIVDGLGEVTDRDVAVFPPFPFLSQVGGLAGDSGLAYGGQDLSTAESGAYTGEVSGGMLKDMGCSYVLAGHSERRDYHKESDELVAEKAAAAQQVGLTPVVCVGETLEEREQGITEAVVGRQLDAVVARLGIAAFDQLVVAYEPVWAIGTGRTATPDQAQQVHAFIRSKIAELDGTIASRLRILYGGSMKGSNAADLLSMEDIDGGLIGGASLTHDEFLRICRA
ncbi:MAG: triose-phosphate isomerase [Xanthomonadales bacterium]|nr:triose-phosphate isomerase [Xanthomonadales bacterium]